VLVKPLGYSALYEKTSADSEFRQFATSLYSYVVNNQARSAVIVSQDNTVVTHGSFANGFRSGEYDASSIDRKARDKLLENLKDQKVNLAQAFVEREETVKTVASTAKTIASVLTNLHKGNFSGAAKALGIKPPKRGQRKFLKEYANDTANAVGNGWLALQYGWKPLLNDVYGAAETLAQASLGVENKNGVYTTTSGQSKKNLRHRSMINYAGPAGYGGYNRVVFQCDGFYL
jgi:hypothetical protein